MSIQLKSLLTVTAIFLLGCQAAPPVPSDKYFRLEAIQGGEERRAILSETLYIAPLRAEGPYAERAMLYATAEQPRLLQQYHYQHWSEPPALLLQEHLRTSLEKLAIAPHVTDIPIGSGVGYLLNGKILRMEKIIEGDSAKAVVSLHLAMQKKKTFGILFEQNYTEEVSLTDMSQNAYVVATELALKKIYENFCKDIDTQK